MPHIFCFIQYTDGKPDDSAAELIAAARKIDAANAPIAVVTGWGKDVDGVCECLCTSYKEVWKITAEALVYPNAELVRAALVQVVPPGSILLVPHNHFGIDLSPGLSIKLNTAYVSDVVEISGLDGTLLRLVRQEFGGQVSTHTSCDMSSGAVLSIRPGTFKASNGASAVGRVREWPVVLNRPRRRYLSTEQPESGDVDITKYKVLVSVGRGIQEPDNIALAEELAGALGGAVSCSRPVVDAKWLDKSRQVGSSGKAVKPNVYLACGISGSFQHLAGLKGNPLIVAINKNPKAPIFRAASIGIVDDILEFLPALTALVREKRGVAAR